MISAFSAPTQVYLSLVDLLKVFFLNGDNENVLQQFTVSTIKMFLNFHLPWVMSSLMAAAKATDSTLFP